MTKRGLITTLIVGTAAALTMGCGSSSKPSSANAKTSALPASAWVHSSGGPATSLHPRATTAIYGYRRGARAICDPANCRTFAASPGPVTRP
jgi:hypothetical protein